MVMGFIAASAAKEAAEGAIEADVLGGIGLGLTGSSTLAFLGADTSMISLGWF